MYLKIVLRTVHVQEGMHLCTAACPEKRLVKSKVSYPSYCKNYDGYNRILCSLI